MYSIKIIVTTSINGPERRTGSAKATLEYVKKNGETATLEIKEAEVSTTQNRLTLIGIVRALKRLNANCDITISTSCEFVANTIKSGRLKKWEENGWKTAKDQEVANADLWQQLAKEIKQHRINLVKTKYDSPLHQVEFRDIKEAEGYKVGDTVEFCYPGGHGKSISGSGTIYGFGRTGGEALIVYTKGKDGQRDSMTAEYIKKAPL